MPKVSRRAIDVPTASGPVAVHDGYPLDGAGVASAVQAAGLPAPTSEIAHKIADRLNLAVLQFAISGRAVAPPGETAAWLGEVAKRTEALLALFGSAQDYDAGDRAEAAFKRWPLQLVQSDFHPMHMSDLLDRLRLMQRAADAASEAALQEKTGRRALDTSTIPLRAGLEDAWSMLTGQAGGGITTPVNGWEGEPAGRYVDFACGLLRFTAARLGARPDPTFTGIAGKLRGLATPQKVKELRTGPRRR